MKCANTVFGGLSAMAIVAKIVKVKSRVLRRRAIMIV